MINPAPHPLVIRAETVRLSSSAIAAFGDEVPSDDARVNELLDECARRHFGRAFTVISLAALHKGIRVDAHHLVAGARLLPHPAFLAKLAARMDGDVVGALLGAVIDGRCLWEREAVALYLAAYFSREKGLREHRTELVRRTRMLAREAHGWHAQSFLAGASEMLGDEELSGLIASLPVGARLPTVSAWTEPLLEFVRRPVLWEVDEGDEELAPTTRRRAVGRIGRNEPCPCGSGKKYKRCCLGRDQERLQDSSEIAGVTRAEIRQHLEEYLTPERIRALRGYELARLDPQRIEPELRGIVVQTLALFREFDALLRFFETVGPQGYEGHLMDAVDAAVQAGRIDMAKAFLKVAPLPPEDWLGFPLRLLREGIERSPALNLLEVVASEAVDKPAVDLACDLLRSRWPHVGLLVARGVAPLASPWDRDTLLEELGQARDRLDLPFRDPTEGLEDLWGWSEEAELYEHASVPREPAEESQETAGEDRVARQLLEEKEAELARLRQELADLHRKLDEQESHTPTATAPEPAGGASAPASQVAAADPRIGKLKERVSRLRSELSLRHAERNQLRRQLERTLKRVDGLEARDAVEHPRDADEDDVSWDDASVRLAFRIPVFSKRFRSSAETAPDPIRRRAVILTSRIAAGDETALRGTRRLKVDRDVYRQRVGRDHRLLFRVHAHDVEAVDLVPRKELERAIRELAG